MLSISERSRAHSFGNKAWKKYSIMAGGFDFDLIIFEERTEPKWNQLKS